ncbi:MAG: TolC family protein [Spirochaetales bacterium]|nr:TolC family protein [Spirochaetales bacterium]
MKTTRITPIITALAAAFLFHIPFHCFADADERTVTLDECIRTGLEQSAGLHASRMRVTAARAGLNESYTSFLPAISASFTYSRLSETDPFTITVPTMGGPVTEEIAPAITDSFSLGVSLKQPVFTGFRHINDTAKSSSVFQGSLAEHSRLRLNDIVTIKRCYWSLVRALRTRKVAEEHVNVVEAYLDDVKNLFAQGLATNNEKLKAEIRLSQTKIMKTDADNAVCLAQLRLNLIMGYDGKTNIFPADEPLHRSDTTYDLDGLIQAAMKNRPEKTALREQIKAAEADMAMAQSAWYPSVYIIGNVTYAQPNSRYFPPEAEFNLSWDIGVYAGCDLQAMYRAPFMREQASARKMELGDTMKQLDDAIRIEVTQAWLNERKAAQQIRTGEQILNQAEINLKDIEEKYKRGLSLRSDTLEAELEKLKASLLLTQAGIDYELALVELERAIGSVLQESNGVMEQ